MPRREADSHSHGDRPPTASPHTLSRRQLLKALAASGGALGAATMLPGNWVKPVVDVGYLPAFAQTSPGVPRRLYWGQQLGEDEGPHIFWSTLAGTDIEPLVSDVHSLQTLRLDTVHGKMYWGESQKIRRANLDGTGVEDFIDTGDGLATPAAIALDPGNNHIYYTIPRAYLPPFLNEPGKIYRANLDGSGITELLSGDYSFQVNGLALNVAGGKMYWSRLFDSKIQRANLDGSGVEDILSTGLENLEGIALDLVNGKIYWVDQTQPIKRANLDGSNVEALVSSGLTGPFDITLDLANGKMYWADFSGNKIRRANLDGSEVEDVVTGIERVITLALNLG